MLRGPAHPSIFQDQLDTKLQLASRVKTNQKVLEWVVVLSVALWQTRLLLGLCAPLMNVRPSGLVTKPLNRGPCAQHKPNRGSQSLMVSKRIVTVTNFRKLIHLIRFKSKRETACEVQGDSNTGRSFEKSNIFVFVCLTVPDDSFRGPVIDQLDIKLPNFGYQPTWHIHCQSLKIWYLTLGDIQRQLFSQSLP